MKVNIGRYPRDCKTERKIKIEIDKWDTWDAYHTLSLIIHPLLVEYRKYSGGYPCCLNSQDEWDDIIDQMIYSFKCILDDQYDYGEDFEKRKEEQKKIDEGLGLFGKYFQNLWN